MPPPTWTVGQVLAAADVNNWFVPLAAVKISGQSLASSTTLFGDAALFLPLAASCTYQIDAMINYEGGTQGSSDIKWQFSLPSGATFQYQGRYSDTGGNVVVVYLDGPSTNHAGTNGGGNIRALSFTGLIQVSSTAANLSFNWAQNTSNGTATTVHGLSWMTAQRLT